MELDVLKSAWKDMAVETKGNDELKLMTRENRHPVLKGIRRQLTIETIAWTIFLFVYYDFFDGDQKPLYVNLFLAASVALVLVHSVIGYLTTRNLGEGANLKQSLENYLRKITAYAKISIASRVVSVIALLIYFSSVIKFDTFKYLLLTGILLLIPLQVFLLYRVWSKRIKQLKESISGLS